MPEFPDIPPIVYPPFLSVAAFVAIILFVVASLGVGIYHSTALSTNGLKNQKSLIGKTVFALMAWLAVCAFLPLSGLLRINVLPPPALVYAFACFGIGITLAFSTLGKRLANLPYHWLIGFQIFRLPLELVLHHWYKTETLPIQMTYEGFNFDILTGILAVFVGAWAKLGQPPKPVLIGFNVIGLALLVTVVSIAISSIPSPFKQFEGVPMLLPFYFPFSYIVSVAVTGALIGHLVLFRKLLAKDVDRAI
ncbi:MAG: hypothetical protein AB8B55_22890 [Mariniblastus sp.]